MQVLLSLHTKQYLQWPDWLHLQQDMSSVIGKFNLASLVYGTPAQNTLAILEPPSKIR